MAGLTLAQAEARLQLYLDAEAKVLAKQSYAIGDRNLTLADLAEIQTGIATWDARVKELAVRETGRGRARTVVMR